MPEWDGLGAALALHVMTPRTEPLSQGSVRYWRWPLVLGPALRLRVGDARVDLHAGAALAWVRAQGRNFMPAETRDEFRGGGLVGLRGAYGAGRWKGFLELSGLLWGKTEAFITRGDENPAFPLPRAELYATLGASWAP
jgi:hypothetical protein